MADTTAPTTTWNQLGFWAKVEVGAKQPVALDDATLRFKTTNLNGLIITIRLDRGRDLYDVTAEKPKRGTMGCETRTLETHTGVFFDGLNDLLMGFARKYARGA